jgi:flagellar basal-body rod protein FlgC
MVFNEAHNELLKNYILFKKYDIKIINNGNGLTLNRVNEDILMDILKILHLRIEIIENNIANEHTTRTVDGGPFLRNYLKITIENRIEIIQDSESNIRRVYDPTHPDAIREGIATGYVEYPNVDIIMEYCDLIETIQLYNNIVDYIKKNYENIIVGKINIVTLDEIKHNKKFEKLLEFVWESILELNMMKNNF